MAVSYFSEQTWQGRDGRGSGSEPASVVACTLAVGIAMALVQVGWVSPLLAGTVLLVAVSTLRNKVEGAQKTAAKEVPACPETLQEPPRPEKGQP